jgi:LPPG:FO 2-phospho-L-lactate transferase
MTADHRLVALSGGVGGAKLASGLATVLPAGRLTVVANTGDDFEHLGLHISPDIDSLLYALAGVNDPVRGWGRREESWVFMSELERLGLDTWFQLGDRDLAVHVHRTSRLRAGGTLTAVTAELTRTFGVGTAVLPMTDDSVRTIVETTSGPLAFQEYFVRRRCEPEVTGIRFHGAASARASRAVEDALKARDLAGIVICPSNPWLSIDPILSVPGIREAVRASGAPVVAVSPVVDGKALKGPTVKIMRELGHAVSARAIASHYGRMIDAFVLDSRDAHLAGAIRATGTAVHVADTIMRASESRNALAATVVELIERLRHNGISQQRHHDTTSHI